jgi:hypothetical protein
MLPSIVKTKTSIFNTQNTLKPIFNLQITPNSHSSYRNYSPAIEFKPTHKISESSSNTIETKKVSFRISKLKKENALLKDFILSNHLSEIDQKAKTNRKKHNLINDQFDKLESYLIE